MCLIDRNVPDQKGKMVGVMRSLLLVEFCREW